MLVMQTPLKIAKKMFHRVRYVNVSNVRNNTQTFAVNIVADSVTVCQTYQLLKNCVTLQMTSCLAKPYPTSVMFCTPLCHHRPQRRSTTTSGVVHTRFHFPNTLHICRTVTSSLGCCTNTVINFLSPVFTFLLTFTSQS